MWLPDPEGQRLWRIAAEQQPIDQDENPTAEPNNEEDNEPKETPEAELQEKSENEVIINNNILDS